MGVDFIIGHHMWISIFALVAQIHRHGNRRPRADPTSINRAVYGIPSGFEVSVHGNGGLLSGSDGIGNTLDPVGEVATVNNRHIGINEFTMTQTQ